MDVLANQPKQLWDLPLNVKFRILNMLSTKEILRFRLAGPDNFAMVEDYAQDLQRRLVVTYNRLQNNLDFQSCFQDVDYYPFPALSIELAPHNDNYFFYTQEYGRRFGATVKKLKVPMFNINMLSVEKGFYSTLNNLEVFSPRTISYNPDLYALVEGKSIPAVELPEATFKNIKEFKFLAAANPFVVHFLLLNCPKLNKISYGVFMDRDIVTDKLTRDASILQNLSQFIRTRNYETDTTNLVVEFAEPDFITAAGYPAVEFVELVISHRVELWGMLAGFLRMCHNGIHPHLTANQVRPFLSQIYGLHGLNNEVSLLRLANLKSIRYRPTFEELPDINGLSPISLMENWPSLTNLDLQITEISAEDEEIMPQNIRGPIVVVLNFFFAVPTKISVLKIMIRFVNYEEVISPNSWVPNYKCLTRLDLEIDSYRQQDVTELFRKLGSETQISFLKLFVHHNMDGTTFVGADAASPVFLSMQNLKHFCMTVCPSMFDPDETVDDFILTDAELQVAEYLFVNVFSNARLTCLSLSSISSKNFPVTERSVQALISGAIGETLRYIKYSNRHLLPGGQEELENAIRRLQDQIDVNRTMLLSNIRAEIVCTDCFFN